MKNKMFRIEDQKFADGAITIEHSGDFPGNVILHTVDHKDKVSYGCFSIDLPASMMREIGQALIEMADEAEKESK